MSNEQLTDEQLEELFQFLTGNWYDRDENDVAIVYEIVAETDPQYLSSCIRLIRLFLSMPESYKTKSDLIRKWVWRYLPEKVDAPIEWLRGILALLEDATAINPAMKENAEMTAELVVYEDEET